MFYSHPTELLFVINGISTFVGYLMPKYKAIIAGQQWYCLRSNWVLVRKWRALGFGFVYLAATIQHFRQNVIFLNEKHAITSRPIHSTAFLKLS